MQPTSSGRTTPTPSPSAARCARLGQGAVWGRGCLGEASRCAFSNAYAARTTARQVDRAYIGAPPLVKVRDGGRSGGGGVLLVHKQGFSDAVVWNPAEVRRCDKKRWFGGRCVVSLCCRWAQHCWQRGRPPPPALRSRSRRWCLGCHACCAGQGGGDGRPGCRELAGLHLCGGGAGAQVRQHSTAIAWQS